MRALHKHRPEIHHSDQGVQYAATGYIQLLEAVGVQINQSVLGVPWWIDYSKKLLKVKHNKHLGLINEKALRLPPGLRRVV